MRYFLSTILVIFCICSHSQQLKIKGKTLDDQLEELPGVEIYGQDSIPLTTSKLDGTFEIELQDLDTLYLQFIAMERIKILITDNCLTIEAILLPEPIYHLKSHRKIDRLRKRTFDGRIELHRQAYANGKFQNEMPCFEYEFIRHKPELDEIRKWMKQKKIEIREEFEQLNAGDTVYVPYSGTSTNSVHSGYSNYVDYDCLVEGIVTSKNKKRRGFNISYRVADLDACIYETLTHNDKIVNVGDTIKHNMRYFRLITASNKH
ncbi:MAG: hypothetical protein AAGA64_18355 [Bacteroidota bacterium]